MESTRYGAGGNAYTRAQDLTGVTYDVRAFSLWLFGLVACGFMNGSGDVKEELTQAFDYRSTGPRVDVSVLLKEMI
jgi:hypothetical protein